MAFFDNTLLLSNAQALTTTAASTTIYDVTGAGSGTAPAMVFGTTAAGAAALPGFDIGTGDGEVRPVAYFTIVTALTGGTSVNFQVQAAIDNGSNAPSTYTTIAETGAIVTASLTAGRIVSLPIPSLVPGEALPRFYRFNYTIVGTYSAGTVTAGILLNPPTQVSTQYPSNFTAA